MRILHSHSLPVTAHCDDAPEDRVISKDELQALRDIFRDEPFPDECPELDDAAYGPALEDEQWWAIETRTERHRLLQFVHVAPNVSAALTESANPLGVEFRYSIRTYANGVEASVEGFDSLPTAQAIFRHMTTPLPDGPAPALARSWSMPGELSDDRTDALSGWEGGAAW